MPSVRRCIHQLIMPARYGQCRVTVLDLSRGCRPLLEHHERAQAGQSLSPDRSSGVPSHLRTDPMRRPADARRVSPRCSDLPARLRPDRERDGTHDFLSAGSATFAKLSASGDGDHFHRTGCGPAHRKRRRELYNRLSGLGVARRSPRAPQRAEYGPTSVLTFRTVS